jgi:hypothetical protein
MTGTQEALLPEVIARPSLQDRLLELALDPNTDADKLTKLLDAQLRWEANEARKQFEAAFALFKRDAPKILKSGHVKFVNRDGSVTEYWHAKLDELTKTLGESLRAVGITMAWDSGADGSVTCVLNGFGHTHRGATLTSPPDKSGGKNDVQAVGSRSAYLMRYTSLMTVGEVPEGAMPDNDGRTEGIDGSSLEDWLTTIRDAANNDELKHAYFKAKEAANAASDSTAMKQFVAAKDKRYRELNPR